MLYYFLKEQLYLSKQELEIIKSKKNIKLSTDKKISLDVINLDSKDVIFYKNFLYYAIEINDLNFLKNLLASGYYVRNRNKEIIFKYEFNTTVKGFVSYVGKYYNEEILRFLLLQKIKIPILNIIKNIWFDKNIKIIDKFNSIYKTHKYNNQKVLLQETEILQNLIESENFSGIQNLYQTLGDINIKEIFYYLTVIKNESIIDYIFELEISGDKFYNEMALTLLVDNTKRFIKFYERMNKFKISGELISQIIESENTDLLNYLYNKDDLHLHYSSNILENIIYHSIFKNKLLSLKTLLAFWQFDFSKYQEIKKKYKIQITEEIDNFILNLIEKQKLKNKLDNKLKPIQKRKIEKI